MTFNWLIRAKQDPVWFSQHILNRTPWSKQAEILYAIRDNKEVAVRSCHGIGKTGGVAAPLVLWFLLTNPNDCIVVSTAPTNRQVKDQLWGEINALVNQAALYLGGRPLIQEFKLGPKWFATGFAAPDYDPSKFHGYHAANVLVILDEACGVSKEIYKGADAVTSTGNTRILSIGNPTDPTSEFANIFSRSSVKTFKVDAFSTPNFTAWGITQDDITTGAWEEKIGNNKDPYPYLINPAWVAKMFNKYDKDWNHPYLMGRILAEFPRDSKHSLIPLSWIERAFERDLDPIEPRHFGVDLGAGGDKSVIVERNGPHARILDTLITPNTMETTAWIRKHIESRRPSVVKIDVAGLAGAGIFDRLEEIFYYDDNVDFYKAVAAGRSREPEKNINARADWYSNLRKRFEDGWIDLDPKDGAFLEQGSKIQQVIKSHGKFQVMEKKALIKIIGHSPDELDALAIAFAPIEDSGFVFI